MRSCPISQAFFRPVIPLSASKDLEVQVDTTVPSSNASYSDRKLTSAGEGVGLIFIASLNLKMIRRIGWNLFDLRIMLSDGLSYISKFMNNNFYSNSS